MGNKLVLAKIVELSKKLFLGILAVPFTFSLAHPIIIENAINLAYFSLTLQY